jgi:hypothetical protein
MILKLTLGSMLNMKSYGRKEIIRFIESVDNKLSQKVQLIVIGGSATCLAYKSSRPTIAIDVFESVEIDKKVIEAAINDTGLALSFHIATVADAPYNFEDRLETLPDLKLKNIELLVPEKHDLVLMKIIRGADKDYQDIEAINSNVGLDFETLLTRFRQEMSHVVGDFQIIKTQFLVMIDREFGKEKLETAMNLL